MWTHHKSCMCVCSVFLCLAELQVHLPSLSQYLAYPCSLLIRNRDEINRESGRYIQITTIQLGVVYLLALL